MRVKARQNIVVYLSTHERPLEAIVRGHIEFPDVVPGIGQGYGRVRQPGTIDKFDPLQAVEDISWESELGVWTGLIRLKPILVEAKDGEPVSLTVLQNRITSSFIPGFEIVLANDEKFRSLFEVPVKEQLKKYLIL